MLMPRARQTCPILLAVACLVNTGCLTMLAADADLRGAHASEGIVGVTSRGIHRVAGRVQPEGVFVRVRYACGQEREHRLPGVGRQARVIAVTGDLPSAIEVARQTLAEPAGAVAWRRGAKVLHTFERKGGSYGWVASEAPPERRHYTLARGIGKGALMVLGVAGDAAMVLGVLSSPWVLFFMAPVADQVMRKRPRRRRERPRWKRKEPPPRQRRKPPLQAFRPLQVTHSGGDFPRPRATARIGGKLGELQVRNAGRESLVVHCTGPISTRVEIEPGEVGTLHLLPGRYGLIAASPGEAPLTGKLTVVGGWRWHSVVRPRP